MEAGQRVREREREGNGAVQMGRASEHLAADAKPGDSMHTSSLAFNYFY